MKKLILINGAHGVGKSALANEIKKHSGPDSVFLEGSAFFDKNSPKDAESVAIDCAVHTLKAYMRHPAYENIYFIWNMDEARMSSLLKGLSGETYALKKVTLTASDCALTSHLLKDFMSGLACLDEIPAAIETLPDFEKMPADVKVDVSGINPQKVYAEIKDLLQ